MKLASQVTLANGAGYPILLGPLPATEAALYLRVYPTQRVEVVLK